MWLENSTFFFIGRTSGEHTPHLAKVRKQNGWTADRSATFISRMWRPLFVVLLSTSAALAAQQSTAYDALRVVGTQLDRSLVSRVISVTGTDGDPQPVTWRVVVADRNSASGVLEIEVANGRIVSQRPVAQTSAGATIKTARLNLDSSGAFSVASYTADKSHANFAYASYTLRNNDRGEPVWIVTLQDEGRRPIGTIHIGANRGNVTRVEGLYRGQNMQEAQQDAPVRSPRTNDRVDRGRAEDEEIAADAGYSEEPSADEEDGDENIVKRRLKQMFYRSKRDAQRMFGRVRSSFEDYFYRR